jgi:pantoate--beta-alanine ligase
VRRTSTREELRRWLHAQRAAGRRIAFVPTMGALHEGHLSLIDLARRNADLVVISIFVNPLQFGPTEDLARYPRDPERDASLAEARGADVLFAPDTATMYPREPEVLVVAPSLGARLEGAARPGHFQGVLTVVAKLFHLVTPDIAVFGQKDYQQLVLVRRMVHDLDMPVEIIAGPIVREADGLALSSRNAYLSGPDRAHALALVRALEHGSARFRAGERDATRLREEIVDVLAASGRVRTQYAEIVHPEALEPVARVAPGSVVLIAAFVGSTRLIDNLILTEDDAS